MEHLMTIPDAGPIPRRRQWWGKVALHPRQQLRRSPTMSRSEFYASWLLLLIRWHLLKWICEDEICIKHELEKILKSLFKRSWAILAPRRGGLTRRRTRRPAWRRTPPPRHPPRGLQGRGSRTLCVYFFQAHLPLFVYLSWYLWKYLHY